MHEATVVVAELLVKEQEVGNGISIANFDVAGCLHCGARDRVFRG
jgi:hypothetical protein